MNNKHIEDTKLEEFESLKETILADKNDLGKLTPNQIEELQLNNTDRIRNFISNIFSTCCNQGEHNFPGQDNDIHIDPSIMDSIRLKRQKNSLFTSPEHEEEREDDEEGNISGNNKIKGQITKETHNIPHGDFSKQVDTFQQRRGKINIRQREHRGIHQGNESNSPANQREQESGLDNNYEECLIIRTNQQKKGGKQIQRWTRKEDDALLKAHEKYSGNWLLIAEQVGRDKTAQDCKNRIKLTKCDQSDCKSTTSTNFEMMDIDNKILQLHKKFSTNWSLIAKHIPGRSAKQIGDRFKKILEPKLKLANCFTQSDDKLLIDLYETYGDNWKIISKRFIGKNPAVLKERYHQIKPAQTEIISPSKKGQAGQNNQDSVSYSKENFNTQGSSSDSNVGASYDSNQYSKYSSNKTRVSDDDAKNDEFINQIELQLEDPQLIQIHRNQHHTIHHRGNIEMPVIFEEINFEEDDTLRGHKNYQSLIFQQQQQKFMAKSDNNGKDQRMSIVSGSIGSHGLQGSYIADSENWIKDLESKRYHKIPTFGSENQSIVLMHKPSIGESDTSMRKYSGYGSNASQHSFLSRFVKQPTSKTQQDNNISLFLKQTTTINGMVTRADTQQLVEDESMHSLNSSMRGLSLRSNTLTSEVPRQESEV